MLVQLSGGGVGGVIGGERGGGGVFGLMQRRRGGRKNSSWLVVAASDGASTAVGITRSSQTIYFCRIYVIVRGVSTFHGLMVPTRSGRFLIFAS